jgi:hypothetical protein
MHFIGVGLALAKVIEGLEVKSMNLYRSIVGALVLASILCTQAFAGLTAKTTDTQEDIELPPEVGYVISKFIESPKDLANFGRTCTENYGLVEQRLKAKKAQHEIHQLLGDVKHLEPGAFRDSNGTIQEIAQGYSMPVDDVTQEQYDFVMGKGEAAKAMKEFPGDKRPMGGLTYVQWDST